MGYIPVSPARKARAGYLTINAVHGAGLVAQAA